MFVWRRTWSRCGVHRGQEASYESARHSSAWLCWMPCRCFQLEILEDFIFESDFFFKKKWIPIKTMMHVPGAWSLRSADGVACPSQVYTSCCVAPGIKGSTEWPSPSSLHPMPAVARSSLGSHGQRDANKMAPLLKRSRNSNVIREIWFCPPLFKIQAYLWLWKPLSEDSLLFFVTSARREGPLFRPNSDPLPSSELIEK